MFASDHRSDCNAPSLKKAYIDKFGISYGSCQGVQIRRRRI